MLRCSKLSFAYENFQLQSFTEKFSKQGFVWVVGQWTVHSPLFCAFVDLNCSSQKRNKLNNQNRQPHRKIGDCDHEQSCC